MSYDPTSTTTRNLARGILGDIDTSNELRADAHYDAILALYGYSAGVAFVANSLAAEHGRKPGSVTLPSGLSVAWRDRVATWLALAQAAISGGLTGPVIVAPFVGGISITDKEAVRDDTDRVPNVFVKDVHGDPALAPLQEPRL